MLIAIEASSAVSGCRTGVGHYTANLMAALQQLGDDDVEYIYLSNTYEAQTARNGAHVPQEMVHTRNRLPSRLLWLQFALPRVMGRVEPDLCHYPNHLLPLLERGNRPSIVTVHDVSVYRFPNSQHPRTVAVHRALLPAIRGGRTMVIAPSTSAREDILDCLHLQDDRVRVIPEGVDPSFSPMKRAEDDRTMALHGLTKPYILSVGTLEPRKNHERLIEAYAMLVREHHIPHQLAIVGADGWRDTRLREALARPDLIGRIRPLGYIPTDHLPAIYRGADLFAFPSLYEGFGLPVLEALASGIPTVISNDPALRELTAGAAHAVDQYSVDSMADGMHRVLSNRTLHTTMHKRGIARARNFSWERCASETLALYREMIDRAF
jgi:glycosyltransferase involved in cell wall biosynthesis